MPKPKKKVDIKVFASAKGQKFYDTQNEKKIVDAVSNHVLPKAKAEYSSVKVKVKRKDDGSPNYLVAYMLRKDTYTADVVKIDVDQNYKVKGTEENYDDSLDDDDEGGAGGITYSEQVDFIAATPVPEIPTAKAAVETLHLLAVNAGLVSKKLLGEDASVGNYRHYLTSGLKGFVNIGHGNSNGIVLDDGVLNHTWFASLSGKPLAPAVVYFNSCQVFNPPLQPAIMNVGARTFIGGIPNLLIGPSEEVCKCFWKGVMATEGMGKALKDCEKKHYPTQGAHGISGYTGSFLIISFSIDQYKAVLYGQDAIANDLAAFIHCYHGGKNVMTCEFYRDDSTLPENRYKGGRIGLVYPWSRFDEIIDVLRNEKPLYTAFIGSNKLGYICTNQEPVGEGDDKS